jgi:hypothetical protein
LSLFCSPGTVAGCGFSTVQKSAALIGKPEDSADDAMECYLSPREHGARDDNTERQAR